MEGETLKTVWNFDGAELNLLFEIKVTAGTNLKDWNLEEAYWSLRDLRRELDAKFNRIKKKKYEFVNNENQKVSKDLTEKEYIDKLLSLVEEERTNFLKSNQEDAEVAKFYSILEVFYMELCSLMKQHGLYFREGSDPSRAIFER